MNYTSLKHAEHNENTCNYLASDKNMHNDWVITTAFYAALHYLRHKIFPSIINVATFEDYCTQESIYGKKHKVMRNLVEDNCSDDIAAAYNQMLDISFTARYSKYKYGSKIAKLAQKRLISIKNYSI